MFGRPFKEIRREAQPIRCRFARKLLLSALGSARVEVTLGTRRHGGHVEQCVVRGGVNGGQWHERARSGPPGATSHRLA